MNSLIESLVSMLHTWPDWLVYLAFDTTFVLGIVMIYQCLKVLTKFAVSHTKHRFSEASS